MINYLEQEANRYATQNIDSFDKIIDNFNIKDPNYELNKIEFDEIHTNYKKLCKFNELLNLSKLFENNNKIYDEIDIQISNSIDRFSFMEIYKFELGNIYKKLFLISKEHTKLSLIDKIEDSNIQIQNIHDCIEKRIIYHSHLCRKHTRKYNIKGHEHEILFSIFMFSKIKKIQKLLNNFKEKYLVLKKQLIIQAENTRRIAENSIENAERIAEIAKNSIEIAKNSIENAERIAENAERIAENAERIAENFGDMNETTSSASEPFESNTNYKR